MQCGLPVAWLVPYIVYRQSKALLLSMRGVHIIKGLRSNERGVPGVARQFIVTV
jgi:hypothetical protein